MTIFFILSLMIHVNSFILFSFIHVWGCVIIRFTKEFFAPLISLHCHPLFQKVFGLWTDFELQVVLKNSDVFEQPFYP